MAKQRKTKNKPPAKQTKKSTPNKKATVKKKPAKKKPAAKKAKRKKTAKSAKPKSLGRPRVSADAKLDQVFQKDYQAREIFDYLGVSTIRELEAHPAEDIIEKVTSPVVQTVQRIRKTLAMANRCLKDDREFALEFKAVLQSRR